MTARERLGGLTAGLLAGTAGGLFGVGGGLVIVPMLTGLFKFSQHQAHGTSLAVIGFTALAALTVYGAHANVAWPTAAVVAVATLISAPWGARAASRISPRGLKLAFALFLLLVAARLFWQAPTVLDHPSLRGWVRVTCELALGLAAGALAGFMGVGGGLIVVPVFTLLFGMTQQTAQGTSLAVMLVTAPAAAFEHGRHGNVVWPLVPMLAVGAALGAPLSSWAAQSLPHGVLVRAFAVFLVANGVYTWLRTIRARGVEAGSPPARPA